MPTDRFRVQVALGIAFLIYLIGYLGSPFLPGNLPEYPLGWWGWFDQSAYLKSARAFFAGRFEPDQHIYPPSYPLLAAPWTQLLRSHAFFAVDAACFLFYLWVLLYVGSATYGFPSTVAAVAAVFIYFPTGTITQWIIPWNSTLAAALFSAMFLIVFWFWMKISRWRLTNRFDWCLLVVFFLVYGLIAPTRPLEIIVCFPLALYFYTNIAYRTWTGTTIGEYRRRLGIVSVIVLIASMVGPMSFLLFNKLIHGGALRGYVAMAGSLGYYLADIPEKGYSLLIRSETIYVEPNQALFQVAPLLMPAFVVAGIGLFTAPFPIAMIVATAFIHFLVYLPFSDLIPHGFFRYFNIHYFKWCFPWIVLIALGEGRRVLTNRNLLYKHRYVLGSVVVLLLVAVSSSVVLDKWEVRPAIHSAVTNQVSVQFRVRRLLDIVDIEGIIGNHGQVDAGGHRLNVDGRELTYQRDYRLFPIANGMRLVLLRPQFFGSLELVAGGQLTVRPENSVARGAIYRFCLLCRLKPGGAK